MTRCTRVLVFATLVAGARATPLPATTFDYVATLRPFGSATNTSSGAGTAIVTYDNVAHTLDVSVTFSDLTTPTSGAAIHAPTTTPLTGLAGVAMPLDGWPVGLTSFGYNQDFLLRQATSWSQNYLAAYNGNPAIAESAFASQLQRRSAYLTIRTNLHLSGEIRGFLEPVPYARLFYNNSALDANGTAVDASDFDAIATDKAPLRFGDVGSFTHISGYSRGINGLFVDVAYLPNDGTGIDAADFSFLVGNSHFPSTWTSAPAPASIGVLPDTGPAGTDRIFITFDDGAITDTWLGITLKANADTGLFENEHFFFGSAPGETGAGFATQLVGADAADLQAIAAHLFQSTGSNSPYDLNHDSRVDAFDLQVVATNLSVSVIDHITPVMGLPATSVAIPEPTAGALFAVAVLLMLCASTVDSRALRVSTRSLVGSP
jgi:hypothetical protein